MRRVELLLEQARRESDNESPTSTSGIADLELVQYINDAQDKLQSIITKKHARAFISEDIQDLTSGTEAYTLPANTLLDNRLLSVEIRHNTGGDYWRLPKRDLTYRYTDQNGTPAYYIRRSGQILLNPIPDTSITNGLRINYAHRLRDLDIRRGLISSASKTSDVLDTITLDLSPTLTKDDGLVDAGDAVLNSIDYISAVDRDGTTVLEKIPVDSYNTTTGVITVTASFSTTVTAAALAGAYIVGGTTATSHSELPEFCERFLVSYVAWKLLSRDASTEADQKEKELVSMGRDISDAFGGIDEDIEDISITHPEWLI